MQMENKKSQFFLNLGHLTLVWKNGGTLSKDIIAKNNQQQSEDYTENETGLMKYEFKKPLVHVIDIKKYNLSERLNINDDPISKSIRFSLDISDGVDSIKCSIDESLNHLIELNSTSNFEKTNEMVYCSKTSNQIKLRKGSIIIVNKIKLLPIELFLNNTNDLVFDKKSAKKIIYITNFNFVGYCEVINENRLAVSVIPNPIDTVNTFVDLNKQAKETTEISFEITHTIAELEPCLSKFYWSIRCKLVSKTPIKDFDRNGNKGRFMRLLLLDSSGQIEAVVFDELCESHEITSLRLEKFYVFRYGEIKPSQHKTKAWNDRCTSRFELKINKTTEIFEITQSQLNNSNTFIQSTKSENISGKNRNLNFVKFSDVLLQNRNCEFDIIGLLDKIGNVNKTKDKFGKELSVRYVEMIDNSCTKLNVSFWGKQAEEFPFSIGACLIIKHVKITNFKGVTIMVQRISEIHEITRQTKIQEAQMLIDWHHDNKINLQLKPIEFRPIKKSALKQSALYNLIDATNKLDNDSDSVNNESDNDYLL